MTSAEPPKSKRPKPNSRDERLKAALKANMARRKSQARERAVMGDNAEDGQSDRQDEG